MLLLCFAVCSEKGSHYAVLVGLEFAMQTKLALNSQKSTCICILSAEIKNVCHYAQPKSNMFLKVKHVSLLRSTLWRKQLKTNFLSLNIILEMWQIAKHNPPNYLQSNIIVFNTFLGLTFFYWKTPSSTNNQNGSVSHYSILRFISEKYFSVIYIFSYLRGNFVHKNEWHTLMLST